MNDLLIEMLVRDHRDRIERELTEIRLEREALARPARRPGPARRTRIRFADRLIRSGLRLGRQADPVDVRAAAAGDLDCVCRPRVSGGQA